MAKNFQNGRPMHRAAAMPYKKPFKNAGNNGGGGGQGFGGNFNQMMFNASQIPDNPGYMDFTNPSPSAGGGAGNSMGQMQQKKKNNKNKQKGKQQSQFQQPQRNQQAQNNGGNWNKNKGNQFQGPNRGNNNRFNNGNFGGGPRNFNNAGPMQNGPNRGRGMGPQAGLGPRGNMGMPPMPPHGFQAPMIPPMPPMGRGPMHPPMGPQPPPFLRRSGRMGPMPPIPPQIPPMIPPRIPRNMPPVPFNNAGKVKKPNTKVAKKVVKGKSTIKTLKNLVNQYPIEKPWVTAEIRAEHEKKIDIENRLKGNKNDELFAEFKVQRDKFVTMYEKAREEYLKKEAAAVKAKDAKDKQTNNKTAAKEENKKEANANAKK